MLHSLVSIKKGCHTQASPKTYRQGFTHSIYYPIQPSITYIIFQNDISLEFLAHANR